jgi:capsular polysaccharide biosynthesis protein
VEVRAFDSEYELKHEEDTLQNQAKWFADKDLIIMAHGAAMPNVIFVRPGTAVVELFPRYYMNNMFWDLMAQCGLYHSWYYDGNMTDRHTQQIAQTETDEQRKNRMQHKKSDIDYKWKNVDHIMRPQLKGG